MKYERRIIISIFWIVLGAILFILSMQDIIDSTFWSGMGGGLFAIGIMQVIRQLRYRTDPEYKEAFDTEMSDERNKFIRSNAWAWAGYIYILIAAIATVVFYIIEKTELSHAAGLSVAIMVFLYWISYFILKQKY